LQWIVCATDGEAHRGLSGNTRTPAEALKL
jgi:hypothetical protein